MTAPREPVLRRLGFSADDRAVVVNVDDLGMFEAGLAAFADLLEVGLVSSASLMANCPGFDDAAAFCRAHPEVDVGVHATLTSEWEGCRWGPLSTRDPASGLLDEAGRFPRRRATLWERAEPHAAAAEIRAQLARLRRAGIDPSHLDSHMFSAFHPRLLPSYFQVGYEDGVLPVAWRGGSAARWLAPDADGSLRRGLQRWDELDVPLVDHLAYLPLNEPEGRLQRVERLFSELPAGLTHLIIHPARDTPELRALTPQWPSRVADYEAFRSPELRRHVDNLGIAILGYRPLCAALHRAAGVT